MAPNTASATKPPMPDLAQSISSGTDSSTSSIQINDFEFCSAHGKEVCADCGIDTLEDNDFVAGIDHVDGREPIEVAFAHNKNGEVVCKKHSAKNDSCFAFKKQIVKLSKEAVKTQKKSKKVESNLF